MFTQKRSKLQSSIIHKLPEKVRERKQGQTCELRKVITLRKMDWMSHGTCFWIYLLIRKVKQICNALFLTLHLIQDQNVCEVNDKSDTVPQEETVELRFDNQHIHFVFSSVSVCLSVCLSLPLYFSFPPSLSFSYISINLYGYKTPDIEDYYDIVSDEFWETPHETKNIIVKSYLCIWMYCQLMIRCLSKTSVFLENVKTIVSTHRKGY